MLHHLFLTHLATALGGAPVNDEQLGFQPPNDDWRTCVSQLGDKLALNIYLVDLRENRKLRSNERLRHYSNGDVIEEPAPARLDCHYLITAWSPAIKEADKIIGEHRLLYETAAVLMDFQTLVPQEVYESAERLPAGFPSELADAELPMSVLPVEGFPKYAEFWGTMGQHQPWKPAIYLVVTVPVLRPRTELGAMVTTRIIEYGRGGPELPPSETWVQIGGLVRDGAGEGIADAWVGLETPASEALQTATTDESGRFTFGGLAPGEYRVRVRATGVGEAERVLRVPATDGNYDIQFP